MRSKTVNVTALAGAVIVIVQQFFGIELSVDTVVWVFGVLSVVLRMITGTSLESKNSECADGNCGGFATVGQAILVLGLIVFVVALIASAPLLC